MVIFENIDIDKEILENIDIDIDKEILEDIDIGKEILEDIDKEISENIDIDKISNRLEFCISNRAMTIPQHNGAISVLRQYYFHQHDHQIRPIIVITTSIAIMIGRSSLAKLGAQHGGEPKDGRNG